MDKPLLGGSTQGQGGSPTFMRRLRNSTARLILLRRPQPFITRCFVAALVLSATSLLYFSYYVAPVNLLPTRMEAPRVKYECRREPRGVEKGPADHLKDEGELRVDNRIMVVVETLYTQGGRDIIMMLESARISYKVLLAGKSLPSLTQADKGKFGVIIFERLESYLNMDKWNRQLLDKYCRQYSVGIIAFAHPDEQLNQAEVVGFPLLVTSKLRLHDYELNGESKILRIARAGSVLRGRLPSHDWTAFTANHSSYLPLSWAWSNSSSLTIDFKQFELEEGSEGLDSREHSGERTRHVTVVHDCGLIDGVQRVLFGYGLGFWLHRVLFLDALSFLSQGRFSSSLERFVLVDVDDMFVGQSGHRMKPADVEAMIESQRKMRNIVEGFHFNLGFSGKYYRTGFPEENDGDELLIARREEFWWFDHSWKHGQAHKFFNYSSIEADMIRNKQFAQLHGLVVNQSYSVAPHHAGVYPVHEDLYDSWRQVWGVRVTSTEEYPHLQPARHRRGFIHKDIMVLPRQTCGLFTHTIFLEKFPGGKQKLHQSIFGGELFQLFLFNKVNVFMTHMSNYGNDRLAFYTFESLFRFIDCWTNLRLRTVEPLELAQIYFNLYPEEKQAIWRNPCNDKRHKEIWSVEKSCSRLPHFLVIGPQKTGTTALYTFLSMHPSIVSNFESETTFEEVQFFNGKNYRKGLDWYMEHFPLLSNTTGSVLFEKSANYFDSEEAPIRSHALLPESKLICILIDPAKRAYSWYQHMKAHGDAMAVEHSFYEVITANDTSSKALREIRNRCLNPGLYSQHLTRWLEQYDSSQLLILDGDSLRSNPVETMVTVQEFLSVEPMIDYSLLLKYDPKKGFYCQITSSDKTKCLGKGKGRVYPPMDEQSTEFLRTFYRRPNIVLSKLLSRLKQPVPLWLEETLSGLR